MPYSFSQMNDYQIIIPANKFKLSNGGVLQLNLMKINPFFVSYNEIISSNFDFKEFNPPYQPYPLLKNKGEILFFKKPSKVL